MRRIARLTAVLAAVIVSLAPTPASAAAGVMVFTGAMSISTGPVVPIGPPVDGSWAFTGTGTAADTQAGLGAASIRASGLLHVGIVNVFGPSCLFSAGGEGVGSVSLGTTSVDFHGLTWRQSAAGTIIAHGLTGNGQIVIVMTVVPPAGSTDNCVAGSPPNFTIFGQSVITH